MIKDFKTRWDLARTNIELPDIVFFLLRLTVFIGGFGWLYFSALPPAESSVVLDVFIFSLLYTFLIYILFFFRPREQQKRQIYFVGLIFDVIFISLLVYSTGGFNSSFFIGYYLLTLLHTFYFGMYYGIAVAFASSILYLFAGNMEFYTIRLSDYFLRISFLFLIALALGLLSRERQLDKERILALTCEIEKALYDLEKSQTKLVEAEKLAALGRLTADVAHEIRNPLTSVGGFAKRLLKNSGDMTRAREYAEIIVSEVTKLEKTLKDVLIFSRETPPHMEPTQAEDMIDEFLKEFNVLYSERPDIVIKKEYNSVPYKVSMDRDQIRLVLYNLVFNAIDAMPQGGILTFRTRAGLLSDIDYIIIGISDTGVGMPQEKLQMIFEPFYTTKEIGAGTGLGLSICKKIMEEHGGQICAKSELSRGSTFSLYFPLSADEKTEDVESREFMECAIEKNKTEKINKKS